VLHGCASIIECTEELVCIVSPHLSVPTHHPTSSIHLCSPPFSGALVSNKNNNIVACNLAFELGDTWLRKAQIRSWSQTLTTCRLAMAFQEFPLDILHAIVRLIPCIDTYALRICAIASSRLAASIIRSRHPRKPAASQCKTNSIVKNSTPYVGQLSSPT
jgi:hypothetical protein